MAPLDEEGAQAVLPAPGRDRNEGPARLAGGSAYWTLFWELSRCDAKLREQGTVLGFLWTLLHPLLLFGVMHQLFKNWMANFIPDYGFYLLVGIVQFTFFADATGNGLRSLLAKAQLIRGFAFRREIVVLSAVAVVLWAHLLELGVVLGVLLAAGKPSWTWAYLPVLVVIEVAWTVPVCLVLAPLAVRFRDVERIWRVLMQAAFFLVPIFYPLQLIAERKAFVLMLNPLVHIMDGMRACLLRNELPPAWIVAALCLGGALACAASLAWFRRSEACLADAL